MGIQPTEGNAVKAIGFTGSRTGLSDPQKATLETFISTMEVSRFHSGDCKGCDAQAFKIVRRLRPNAYLAVHPPSNKSMRAYCRPDQGCGIIHPPKECLARNRDIVNTTDLLLATPDTIREKLRSGTWATIRFARKVFKPIVYIFPDGTLKLEKPREHQ